MYMYLCCCSLLICDELLCSRVTLALLHETLDQSVWWRHFIWTDWPSCLRVTMDCRLLIQVTTSWSWLKCEQGFNKEKNRKYKTNIHSTLVQHFFDVIRVCAGCDGVLAPPRGQSTLILILGFSSFMMHHENIWVTSDCLLLIKYL